MADETDFITELTALVAQFPRGSKNYKHLTELLARFARIEMQWEANNRERETDKTGDPAYGRDLDREVAVGLISQEKAQAVRKASLKHRARVRERMEKQLGRMKVLSEKTKQATREFVEATMPELRNASPKERLELFSQMLDQAKDCDPQAVEETKMGIGLLLIRGLTPSEDSTQIN